MSAIRSMDDLKSAYLHFNKSVEEQIQSMPQYFGDEKSVLDVIYSDIDAASKVRTTVGVQKTTDVAQSNAWTQKADDALSRAKLYLRATAPDKVREYFPDANGGPGRKIDRLYVIDKALTVSDHFGHTHLSAFKAELETLRTQGEAIFGAATVSVTGQKTEVEKLKELREKWESQHQKLKYLFRGYFHGTPTDWSKFFYEKRSTRPANAKGDAPVVSDTPSI